MNNSAAKVGEIFTEAGAAFNKLAEMTMMLHPIAEISPSAQSKTPVKKKTVEERQVSGNSGISHMQHNVHTSLSAPQQVTLNMLNTQAMEKDNMGVQDKLDFETSTEDVPA